MRANEQGIRWMVQNVAALAADDLLADRSRMRPRAARRSISGSARNLDVPPGTQKIEDIEAELAGAQTTLAARHRAPPADQEHARRHAASRSKACRTRRSAAQILALQTRLQASLQTTSLLYQTSLVNYI